MVCRGEGPKSDEDKVEKQEEGGGTRETADISK